MYGCREMLLVCSLSSSPYWFSEQKNHHLWMKEWSHKSIVKFKGSPCRLLLPLSRHLSVEGSIHPPHSFYKGNDPQWPKASFFLFQAINTHFQLGMWDSVNFKIVLSDIYTNCSFLPLDVGFIFFFFDPKAAPLVRPVGSEAHSHRNYFQLVVTA